VALIAQAPEPPVETGKDQGSAAGLGVSLVVRHGTTMDTCVDFEARASRDVEGVSRTRCSVKNDIICGAIVHPGSDNLVVPLGDADVRARVEPDGRAGVEGKRAGGHVDGDWRGGGGVECNLIKVVATARGVRELGGTGVVESDGAGAGAAGAGHAAGPVGGGGPVVIGTAPGPGLGIGGGDGGEQGAAEEDGEEIAGGFHGDFVVLCALSKGLKVKVGRSLGL
jgi:hypothetical protein